MRFSRLLSFVGVLCWVGFVHARSEVSQKLFETMMGQKGTWDWNTLSQKKLWKIRAVKKNSKEAKKQYSYSLCYLEKEALITIPKIIHFIWIGPKAFPENSIANLISWQRNHPHWEIFFWTDNPKREVPLKGMTRRLVAELDLGVARALFDDSTNWGEKADILRYAIMYEIGGIYADHDVECIRPLDHLTAHYDFIAGYSPLHNYSFSLKSPFVPNNGLIISRPHHLILEKTLERVVSRWETIKKRCPGKDELSVCTRVMSGTFDSFAYCSSKFLHTSPGRNILMPACYFQAADCFNKKMLNRLSKRGFVYAIHHFDNAWVASEK